MKHHRCLLILVGCMLVTTVDAAQYQVVDFGDAAAESISAEGMVVGAVHPTEQAAALAPAPAFPFPFLPEGNFSRANGVSGPRVVGYSSTGHLGLQTHAFLWTAATGTQDLGTWGDPELFSAATAVNEAATICGYAEDPGLTSHPVVWIAGQLHDLGTLGGDRGFADAMNEQGDIVGESLTTDGRPHATLWPIEGGILDLDTPAGPQSFARAVNNARQVVGGAVFTPVNNFHAFIWTPMTGMQDLGVLPGHGYSDATGINDAGVIVGTSVFLGMAPSQERASAVLWWSGTIVDLNTQIDAPGWILERATAINAAGWIVGQGTFQGQPRAFLLQPVPEEPPAAPDPRRRLVRVRHPHPRHPPR